MALRSAASLPGTVLAQQEKTEQYYDYGWNMLKSTPISGMPLDQITRDVIEPVRFPGSPANGNAALRTLRRMLGKAVDWGMLQTAARIKLLQEQGREILIGADTEAKLLRVAAQPLRDVFVIMQDTGMRPQDVFRLRWEYVNWQKGLSLSRTAKPRTPGGTFR